MLSSFTKALTRTAAQIDKTIQTTVQEVTGPKALADYDLGDQVGSGGPGMLWKLYRATPKNKVQQEVCAEVCVWYLDKKELADERSRRGTSKAAEDQLLDLFRNDAKLMQKLRHPGVVRVIEALDESKTAMSMVTEPIFSSLANALGNIENLTIIPAELENLELGQLEVKHGLMQLAETLSFINRNAKLIHRGISPESIFITTNGGWKIAGFGFSAYVDDEPYSDEPPFLYPDFDVDGPVLPLQPPLDYTAPELTRRPSLATSASLAGRSTADARCSVDVFSLGLLAYQLITKRPLLRCHSNLQVYHSRVSNLRNEPMSNAPMDLENDLRRMLSAEPTARPTASEFAGSPFFTEDIRLRALRFLDEMIGRDVTQKTEFLTSLQNLWSGFDSRVLRFKVLPPLLEELRSGPTQRLALPWILEIAEVQDAKDFEVRTQPALLPAMQQAGGDVLLLFLKHLPALAAKSSNEIMMNNLLPMVVRAFEDPDPRVQEETLRRAVPLINKLDFEIVKQLILPRVHMLALRTSVAAVRVHALVCLGDLVPTLDKPAVMDILQTLARCASVDHSPPTLMCILGVADVVHKQYGVEFAAEFILPLITPLLVVQQLSGPQFARFLKLVMDILNVIQDKKGVSLSEADEVSLDLQSMGLGVGQLAADPSQPLGGSAKSVGPSWDTSDSWSSAGRKAPTSPSQSADPFASLPPLSAPSTSLSPPAAANNRPVSISPSLADPFALPPTNIASLSLSPPLSSQPPSSHPPSLSAPSFANPLPAGNDPFAASSFGSINSSGLTPMAGFVNMTSAPSTAVTPGLGGGSLSHSGDSAPNDDPFADWPPKKSSAASQPGQGPASFGQPYSQSLALGQPTTSPQPDLGAFFSAPAANQRPFYQPSVGIGGGMQGSGGSLYSNQMGGGLGAPAGGFRLAPPPGGGVGMNVQNQMNTGANMGYQPPNPAGHGNVLDLL